MDVFPFFFDLSDHLYPIAAVVHISHYLNTNPGNEKDNWALSSLGKRNLTAHTNFEQDHDKSAANDQRAANVVSQSW